jgi:hypothetical protein
MATVFPGKHNYSGMRIIWRVGFKEGVYRKNLAFQGDSLAAFDLFFS